MSYHVNLDHVVIDEKAYNLSFIILKNGPSNDWVHYYRRIDWNDDVRVPKSFYILDLATNGRHTYHPCAPFHLSRDPCADWLTWDVVRPPNANGDELKMLLFKSDPETLAQRDQLETGISGFIQFGLWADQLASNQPPQLGNLSRMENLVRSTINTSLKGLSNNIVNRIRSEVLDDPDRRRRRSRSPNPRRAPSQPQPMTNQPLYGQISSFQTPQNTYSMVPQQIMPQQMIPQQMIPQQVMQQQMMPQQIMPQQQLMNQQMIPVAAQWNPSAQAH